MKSSLLILGAAAVLLVVGVVYFIAGKAPSTDQRTKAAVAATIYPLYDIARNVAGEDAEVKLILPPGASPHLFEFSPKQLEGLQNAREVFAIGHGLDDWAAQVASVAKDARVIVVDRGIELRKFENGAIDPHYWLHLGNARQIADNIAKSLAEVDPEHAEAYRARSDAYKMKLSEKERELKEVLTSAQGKPILTFHDAWFYFAGNFGLTIAGTFEPAAGEEPTPRYLAALRQEIGEKRIRIIFVEPQLSTAVLESFAEDNHLSVAELDPLGGVEGRKTYLELMEFNANSIRRALEKKGP
ncbi:MAG TPA: metal ABC transporter substrate-binding protein [Nitrospiria bacterium]|nr:metal ABC transporter substrate-binding protein [Nitrospiria bacterium]